MTGDAEGALGIGSDVIIIVVIQVEIGIDIIAVVIARVIIVVVILCITIIVIISGFEYLGSDEENCKQGDEQQDARRDTGSDDQQDFRGVGGCRFDRCGC